MTLTLMRRTDLVHFLDDFLDIGAFTDKSLNGLQVEGVAEIARVSFAVDFSEQSAAAARKNRSQMLLVHHGYFWGQVQPISGPRLQQLRPLIEGGINLYAAHLPLDAHPEVGNNIQLARLLGLRDGVPFGIYQGRALGVVGTLPESITPEELAARLDRELRGQTNLLKFGPKRIRRLAIVSGDAAMLVEEAAGARADALLTGETSHTAYNVARSCRVHLLCSGHYATETIGLKALAKELANGFGLETRWIDLPTGL